MTLSLSNPKLFSSLSVTAGNQTSSATVPLAASNELTFSPPLTLAAGTTLTFTATATIAKHTAMNLRDSGKIDYAAVLPISVSIGDRANLPLLGGLAIVGLVPMLWVADRRRRFVFGALLILVLATGSAGCTGGGGSEGVKSKSTITVTAASASGGGGATAGLPLTVATVGSHHGG